jgi:hypothetical protein
MVKLDSSKHTLPVTNSLAPPFIPNYFVAVYKEFWDTHSVSSSSSSTTTSSSTILANSGGWSAATNPTLNLATK